MQEIADIFCMTPRLRESCIAQRACAQDRE